VTLPIEQCKATIAKHSKSFALASRLLPANLRDDAVVLYAYCRHVDDTIDLVPPEQHPLALEGLRRELDTIVSGSSEPDLLLGAYQELFSRCKIPRIYADELLNGMEMDCLGTTYADEKQLLLYCYRVAGTVGLMMCHVLGVSSPVAMIHAAHLGLAMQLTNICRDVDEDAKRGRLYLPQRLLKLHGSEGLAPVGANHWTARERQSVATTTADLLALADQYYASGDLGLRYLAAPTAYAVAVARAVYADIGRVLRARHCNPLGPRAFVSKARKLYLAANALPTLRRQPPQIVPLFPETPLTFEALPLLTS
jgi:phytoene synthase